MKNFFRSSFFVEHLLTAGSAFFQAGLLVLSSEALEQIVLDKKICYESHYRKQSLEVYSSIRTSGSLDSTF